MATTRYRLRSTTTAPAVTPSIQSYTHTQTSRRQLLTSDSSALTTSAYTPDASDDGNIGDAHHIQFVSDPLAAGIVYDIGNAVALGIQGLEPSANNNLFVQLFVSVVNSSGVEQAVLRSKVVDGTELGTSLASIILDSTLDGSYTTSLNDRLVVEISVQGDPAGGGGVQGHNASLRWGSNGAGGDITTDGQTGTTLNPWFEIEDTEPVTDRQYRLSWAELEVPTAPRRYQVSFAELEVPTAPRRYQLSFAEFEVPTAPRRYQVSWAELEIPNADRRYRISFAEFEVPDAPTNDRRYQVSFTELEVPTAPRRYQLSFAEMEIPESSRRYLLSFAEFEIPDAGGGEPPPEGSQFQRASSPGGQDPY